MSTVRVRYIVTAVDTVNTFLLSASRLPQRVASSSYLRNALSRRPPSLAQCAEWGGGGSQAKLDGRTPEPGGWNRISLEVSDLSVTFEALHKVGVHFRHDVAVPE